jgi:hypothetical protein
VNAESTGEFAHSKPMRKGPIVCTFGWKCKTYPNCRFAHPEREHPK